MNILPKVAKIAWNFNWNLNHLPQSNLAIPNTPIKTPEVGTIIFVKPSPSWKAKTATYLLTPTKSAIGAIIGIVNTACPEPETTRKFKTDWNTYINQADTTVGKSPIP